MGHARARADPPVAHGLNSERGRKTPNAAPSKAPGPAGNPARAGRPAGTADTGTPWPPNPLGEASPGEGRIGRRGDSPFPWFMSPDRCRERNGIRRGTPRGERSRLSEYRLLSVLCQVRRDVAAGLCWAPSDFRREDIRIEKITTRATQDKAGEESEGSPPPQSSPLKGGGGRSGAVAFGFPPNDTAGTTRGGPVCV